MSLKNGMAKDITADLVLGDVNLEENRKNGVSGYNFIPQSVLISPSADDADEYQTIVCETFSSSGAITMILKCGVVHPIPLRKIINASTTSNSIVVFGMSN